MGKRNARRLWVAAAAAIVACCTLAGAFGARSAASRATLSSVGPVSPSAIPLGDGHVSTSPRTGYVDSCQTTFRAGAPHSGPWIDEAAGTWDRTAKIAVSGAVSWPGASYAQKLSGGTRVLTFHDLPIDHATGVFPISPSDPAYQYDRNPNRIAAHDVSWSLSLNPKEAATPSCVGLGPIGVLVDGVYLYNALDAAGRDAAAHEVQDSCAGHPDGSSRYHDHDVPSCILQGTPNGSATLVGFALDGYGVYVVKDAQGNLPTNADLDPCHGTTSVVDWNGKPTSIYHYVATLEYPYTVGCYHGTPNTNVRAASSGKVVRCLVPKVTGQKLKAAKRAITTRHCRTGKVKQAYSKKVQKGRVSKQQPKAGRKLKKGAKVNLTVSKGRKATSHA